MLRFLCNLIYYLVVYTGSSYTLYEESYNEINCSPDEGNIWYIDVNKRFIRTFHNFSFPGVDHEKIDTKMRVCDLVLNFKLDNEVYSEFFELKRLIKANGPEYFLVEHVQVNDLEIALTIVVMVIICIHEYLRCNHSNIFISYLNHTTSEELE